MKKKLIKDPIFGCNFNLCFGDGIDFSKLLLKRHDYEDNFNNDSNAKCIFVESGHAYLFVSKGFTQDILIHELMHMVRWGMERVGIYLCEETDEVFAYYFQFLFKECNKVLNEKL